MSWNTQIIPGAISLAKEAAKTLVPWGTAWDVSRVWRAGVACTGRALVLLSFTLGVSPLEAERGGFPFHVSGECKWLLSEAVRVVVHLGPLLWDPG